MVHVDRWKNRRRMAWASLVAGLGYPLLLLFTDSSQLGSVAGPFYIFVGAVVGAYIGFATVDDKWMNDAKHETDPYRDPDRSPDRRGKRVGSQRLETQRQDRQDGS